jgi:class 3 adenylate cyclase/tetratricopeptide (TPR) repeat protein
MFRWNMGKFSPRHGENATSGGVSMSESMNLECWLSGLGLAEHAEAFRRERVTLDLLPRLQDEDLRALGLPLGDRIRIREALVAMGVAEGTVAPTSIAPPVAVAKPRVLATAERRQLTVLFCDLVGSTALSGAMDPEALRGLMGRYHEACRGVVEKYAGHVAQYLGDGVMAYFGWPVAHEDDAERALRAGLELVGAVKAVTGAPSPLQVRIGVATGPVVVGEGGEESSPGGGAGTPKLAVGETPNLAARLQGLAGPDEIVASAPTRRLAGGNFEVVDLGSHVLKGIVEPVQAWQVVGLKQTEGRFEASRGGEQRLSAFVGREQEVGLLAAKWAQASGGEGQVVLLEGEPGIGKSRITQWLLEHIGEGRHYRLRYQCSPYHQSSALYPVIEQMTRAANFLHGDSPTEKIDKLTTLVDHAGNASPQTVALMAALLGVEADERLPELDLTPQKQKELTLQALTDQVRALSKQAPVLLLLEDAHWIDPSTLELLSLTVEAIRSERVLVLITYRPEFKAQWTGQSHVSHVILNRLSPKQTRALAEHVAGGHALPEEIVAQIVQKTDGIPLFVEELTKAVLEAGLLELGAHTNGYKLKGPLSPIAIPATLRDSLTARLDRLSPTKEVAQIGACIGREFSYALLERVAKLPSDQLDEALDRLVASELVFQRGELPEAVYTFKHALIQDTAYEGLLHSRRAQIHQRIAETLEREFAEAATARPEVVAHHYSRAGMPGKAAPLWLVAGKRALQEMALPESIAQLERALVDIRLLDAGPQRDAVELDARTTLGTAWMAWRGWAAEEIWSVVEPAIPLARSLGRAEALIPLLWGLWVVVLTRGRIEESMRWVDQLGRIGEETGSETATLVAHTARAITHFWLGNFDECRAGYGRVLELYDREKHTSIVTMTNHDPKSVVGIYVVWMEAVSGRDEEALALLDEIDAHAASIDHGVDLIMTLELGAMAQCGVGNAVAAGERLDRGMVVAKEKRLDFFEQVELPKIRICEYAVAGLHERTIEQATTIHAITDAVEFMIGRVQHMQYVAEAHLALGRPAEALAAADEALEQMRRPGWGEAYYEADVLRIRGEVLLALGRREEGFAVLDEALEVALRKRMPRPERAIRAAQQRAGVQVGRDSGEMDSRMATEGRAQLKDRK